jgi:hypothetical protein
MDLGNLQRSILEKDLDSGGKQNELKNRFESCDTLGVKYSKPIGRMFCMF